MISFSTTISLTVVLISVTISLGLLLQLQLQPVYSQNSTEPLLEESSMFYDGLVNATIQYPANSWTFETKNLEYPYVIRLFPAEFMSERVVPVELLIAISLPGVNPNANLTELTGVTEGLIQAEPDFRLINFTSNTNVTLSNGITTIPAFVAHLYDFSRPFTDSQEMTIGTVVNGEYMIMFEYDAKTDLFNKYLPQADKIIESFQLTRVRDRG